MITHIVIAHVGGAPVEEILPLVVSGLGAALLVARSWVGSRVRSRTDDGTRQPSQRRGFGGATRR